MFLINCNTQKEYRIDHHVYENSEIHVWCGVSENIKDTYFVKVLEYGKIEREDLKRECMQIFEEEGRTLRRVSECSERVPRLHDAWNDKKRGRYVLVMDRMPGKSLREWMKIHKTEILKPKDVFVRKCFVIQLCEIMRSISRKYPAIVHRDLKPENIFVDFDKKSKRWKLYVIDFGCANLNHVRNVGTLDYRAPEQIKMQGAGVAVNFKTDVFAIGQILYELMLGKVPRIGEDYTYRVREVQWAAFPNIPEYLLEMKEFEAVAAVLPKMTSLKQEDRPDYGRIISMLKNM